MNIFQFTRARWVNKIFKV